MCVALTGNIGDLKQFQGRHCEKRQFNCIALSHIITQHVYDDKAGIGREKKRNK